MAKVKRWPNSVEMPSQGLIEKELLHQLGLYPRPVEIKIFYDSLAEALKISSAQRQAKMQNSSELAWNNRVRFARRRLANQGFIDKSRRGYWGLTEMGRAAARGPTTPADLGLE
jgi:restriction endonuclease Mrr